MYKVVATDGNESAPVDLETLQAWASEKRITPNTLLLDEQTGERFPADELAALRPYLQTDPVSEEPERRKGTSCIAWGCVIALGACFVMLFHVFYQAGEAARAASSGAHLRQISNALSMYQDDHDGRFPPMRDAKSASDTLFPYVRNESIFISPGTQKRYVPNPSLSLRKAADVPQLDKVFAFYDPVPRRNKRWIVFADGPVRQIPESDWPRVQARSRLPDRKADAPAGTMEGKPEGAKPR